MGRLDDATSRATDFSRRASAFIKDFRANSGQRTREYGARIVRPQKFEKFTEGLDPIEIRLYQILALFLLPVVIIVSLVMIVAMNEIMSEIFGVSDPEDLGQSGILAWFITGITGGLFLLAAWTWFQFVRTCAFGIFIRF